MMSHKRFSFDDEETTVTPNNDLNQPLETKTSINNESNDNDNIITGDKPVVKKKKKKIRKWPIVLLVFILIITIFIVYVFIAGGNNDGPVYGDRCASLLTIDEDKFTEVKDTVKTNPSINDIDIEVNCRIIKISMNFVDNTTSKDAKQLATDALHTLDDALGHPKEEGKAYSNLLGSANGRGQYNVEFVLTSKGDTDFPIFGTKHPTSDEIGFTGANVIDQEATDRALKKGETQ